MSKKRQKKAVTAAPASAQEAAVREVAEEQAAPEETVEKVAEEQSAPEEAAEAQTAPEAAVEEVSEAQPAPEEASEEVTEEQPAPEEAPVKGKRQLRPVMAIVTVLFVFLACLTFLAVGEIRSKREECLETWLPQGLSAVGTVEQYFQYWDDGNNEGMRQAALPDVNSSIGSSDSFVPGLCLFVDIKLESADQLSEVAEGFEGCAESAIVKVDFSYTRHLGFGDETIPEKNTGWEFYLARITEADDFRIIAVTKG